MDFYENVRNDYVYVIDDTSHNKKLRGLDITNDIKSATKYILSALRLNGAINLIEQDLSQYVKANECYEIGLARKNVTYDYMLYQVRSGTVGLQLQSFLSLPLLNSSEVLMLAKKKRGFLSRVELDGDTFYYCNYNNSNLKAMEELGYNILTIGNAPIKNVSFLRIQDYSIFEMTRPLDIQVLKINVYLVSDRIIDGTDNFLVATLPAEKRSRIDRKNH